MKRTLFCRWALFVLLMSACMEYTDDLLPQREGDPDAIRSWFSASGRESFRLRSAGQDLLSFGMRPDWERSRRYTGRNRTVTEFDLYALPDPGWTNHQPETRSTDAPSLHSFTRFVVVPDTVPGQFVGFLMTVIPSEAYYDRYGLNEAEISYAGFPADFDGLVFYYHMDGSFSNGWVVVQGKPRYTADLQSGADFPLNGPETPSLYSNQVSCVDYIVEVEYGMAGPDNLDGVPIPNDVIFRAYFMVTLCSGGDTSPLPPGESIWRPVPPPSSGPGIVIPDLPDPTPPPPTFLLPPNWPPELGEIFNPPHFDPPFEIIFPGDPDYPGFPDFPGYGGDPGTTPPASNSRKTAAEITLAAENAVKKVKEDFGDTVASCNYGVQYAFKKLFASSVLDGKLANEMVDHWVKDSLTWQKTDIDKVQELANLGYFVVAGLKGSEQGHVVVIVPGEMEYSDKWKIKVPNTMDTGEIKRWSKRKLSSSWGPYAKGKVKFFKYIKR